MDYKKKYKEALVNMQELYNSMKYMSSTDALHTTTALERAFPELKENNNKRIKEAISYAIANSTHEDGILINGVTETEAIAWVEKQGNSKFEQCIQDGDKIVTNEDGTHFNISQLKRVAKKESAWSEEDETALCDALWCCKQAAKLAKDENDMGNIWCTEKWLKSLKERIKGE